jgi:hypothetical protein
VRARDLTVALVQLPLPDADEGTAAANVPLAAGCLRAFSAAHGGPGPDRLRVLPRDLAGHGGDAAILDWLASGGFDAVGFTAHAWSVERALLLAGRLRERRPGTRVVFGGPEVVPGHPVLNSPHVDAGVVGEGESAFLAALDALADPGAATPMPRMFRADGPADLSSFPNPYLAGLVERDAADPVYLETVRGCPNRCSYCHYTKEFPGVRSWPGSVLDAIVPWAAALGVPEIYLMDPTFNGTPGWEAKLASIARLNTTGIPLHTELRLENVGARHAALFERAGFRSVEAGLQSTNPAALRAVRRPWNRDRFLRGASLLSGRGIEIRTGVILGLPGDTPEGFRATVRFLEEAGLADGMEVYPLAVLPGTDLRRDAAALGITYQRFPPYHVLSTPLMSADEIAACIRWLEHERRAEFFPPVAPTFRDPAPGLVGFLDLRPPGAADAAPASFDRLANRVTLLAGDELARAPGRLEQIGRRLLDASPSSLVQLVLETDAPLADGLLDRLAEAFHEPAHHLNRARLLDDDPQGRSSIRLFRLTADARAADRALDAGERCDLVLRWPARPAGLARKLLADHPFVLLDADVAPADAARLRSRYQDFERLLLAADRPI